MFYHWSFAQYPGVKVITLSQNEAYVRHYRTVLPSLGKAWYKNTAFEVTRLNRDFEKQVVFAVKKRLDSVYKQRAINCGEIRQELLGVFVPNMYDCVWGNGSHYSVDGVNPFVNQ